MRVKSNRNVGFEPVEIRITLESEEEVKALYSIFNYAHIVEAPSINCLDADGIRLALVEAVGTVDYSEAFRNMREHLRGKRI